MTGWVGELGICRMCQLDAAIEVLDGKAFCVDCAIDWAVAMEATG